MTANQTTVEIIDYKKFPQRQKYGVVGIVFGKVINGLTINYFSTSVFSSELGEDGQPIIRVERAIGSICYEISSEISTALLYLQANNYIDEKVGISVVGAEPFHEVELEGWSECWDTKAQVDLAFFLEDVCEELETKGQAFSQEWFYAKICHLYFTDKEIPDVSFTIGILLSQMWTKLEHEAATIRGISNQTALQKANSEKQIVIKKRAEEKKAEIVKLWHRVCKEHGADAMRKDSNAAQAIYAVAESEKPKALIIRTSGNVIGVEAIRKTLGLLRKDGKLG